MNDDYAQFHAMVSGRVQGVGFRYNTLVRAREIGVVGWVRNLDDGSVEVLAEGTQRQLDDLLAYLRQGPLGARVIEVDVQWHPPTRKFESFDIRP